jgi:hypothetical protein
VLHQPSSLAPRFTKTLTVNPKIELNEAFNSILALNLVLPLDEYLFRRKSEFPLLPSA